RRRCSARSPRSRPRPSPVAGSHTSSSDRRIAPTLRRSLPVSKSAKNDNRVTAKNDNRPTAKRPHPWADAIDGIDYGPAIAALHDLVTWAFGLALTDVADWPEGQRRVRAVRKHVRARLAGKHPRAVPYEDIFFTAGLLARIFEAEIGLDMAEMVAVLDE